MEISPNVIIVYVLEEYDSNNAGKEIVVVERDDDVLYFITQDDNGIETFLKDIVKDTVRKEVAEDIFVPAWAKCFVTDDDEPENVDERATGQRCGS